MKLGDKSFNYDTVIGFCRNNNCIICPLKTVGKVGKLYAYFPGKDNSKNLVRWHIGPKIIFVLQLKKIYKYMKVSDPEYDEQGLIIQDLNEKKLSEMINLLILKLNLYILPIFFCL